MKYSIVALFLLFLTSCNQQSESSVSTYRKCTSEVLNPGYFAAGVYYYPEQWPREEWNRDLKRIKELGFDFTHFAEFAWSRLEPSEGNFQFEWLDTALALAYKHKLKVVLCTPSATPPAWLSEKHPDILAVDNQDKTLQHGAREQASWSSATYRTYVAKIVRALAERYGRHPAVMGWQLDNEPSHYGLLTDYHPETELHFRAWLQKKYSSTERLNHCWGNSFWSQEYNDFSQIHIPKPERMAAAVNPHALLDYQEFLNDERADFLAQQATILKQHCDPAQFVTTNYMTQLPYYSPFQTRNILDFTSYTCYPLNSYSAVDAVLGHRLGSGADLSFAFELHRSVNGITGVMELQPGQVNWGRYNSQPMPGAIRQWIWHTYALGAKFICTYRYRQPLFGNEQYHTGIMEPDGVTLSRGGKEFTEAIREIKATHSSSTMPDSSAVVALLLDQRSLLDLQNFPHTYRWNTMAFVQRYYTILKSFGLRVEILSNTQSLEAGRYRAVIAPSLQLVDSSMLYDFKNYLKNGGNLYLTCRSFQKDQNAHLWKGPYSAPLEKLGGFVVKMNDHLPEGKKGRINYDGHEFSWSAYAEVLEIVDSGRAQALATHKDDFYASSPAVVQCRYEKGSIWYNGVYAEDHQLDKALLRNFLTTKFYKLLDLPENVFVESRDALDVITNYNGKTVIVQNRKIAPGQCLVLQKKQIDTSTH